MTLYTSKQPLATVNIPAVFVYCGIQYISYPMIIINGYFITQDNAELAIILSQMIEKIQNEINKTLYMNKTYHFIDGIILYNVDNSLPRRILLCKRYDDGSPKKPEAIRSIPTSSFSSYIGPISKKNTMKTKFTMQFFNMTFELILLIIVTAFSLIVTTSFFILLLFFLSTYSNCNFLSL